MEWIDEKEYDHIIYFKDTTTKLLTSSYLRIIETTVIYKYKYLTASVIAEFFLIKVQFQH